MGGKSPSLVPRNYVPQCQYCVVLPVDVHFPHYCNAKSLNVIYLPQLQLDPEERVGTTYPSSLSTVHNILKKTGLFIQGAPGQKESIVSPLLVCREYLLFVHTLPTIDCRVANSLVLGVFSQERCVWRQVPY